MEPKDKSLRSVCMNDAEITAFRHRDLNGPRFLECADHIEHCDACREKLARQADLAAARSQFEQDLAPFVDHISDDEIQLYVSGQLGLTRIRELDGHLARCAQCADEVRDLTAFVGSLNSRRTFFLAPRFLTGVGVAAAMLIVALATFIWLRQPSQVVALNDASGKLALDAHGRLTGAGPLDADQQRTVVQVLTQQKLSLSASLQPIRGTSSALMGAAERPLFRLVSPLGTVVQSSRPTLLWTTVPESTGYKVVVKDESVNARVESPLLHTTSWTVPTDLERSHTYVWQVVCSRKVGGDVIAPEPPASPARFIVLDESTNAKLQHLPPSHLVRAVLYANAGLLDDANRELNALEKVNPESPLLRSLRDQLQQLHTSE